MRTCQNCGKDISDRRSDAIWCSTLCRRISIRADKIVKAVLRRPRCMICGKPIRYGENGINYRTATCSAECHVKRNNWFKRKPGRSKPYVRKGPPPAEYRQERARKAALARWGKSA